MKISKISNFIINFFLLILVVTSLIGAVSMIPAIVGRTTKSILFFLALITLMVDIAVTYFGNSLALLKKIKYFLVANKRLLLLLLSLFTLLWQLLLLTSLHGQSLWDPSIIESAAAGLKFDKNYFSFYPNTLLLLFFEHFIYIIAGYPGFKDFTLVLGIINLILLDASLLILIVSIRRHFNKTISTISAVLFWILIVVSPLVVIPYSDIWALFFSSVIIGLGYQAIEIKNLKKKLLFCSLLGITLAISYLVKPSLLVYLIAWILIQIVIALAKERRIKELFLSVIFLVLPLLIVPVFNQIATHTNLVRVEKERSMTLTHYMAMGLASGGGYNEQDVLLNEKIKNKEQRNKINTDLIEKRLREKGTTGYIKFLFSKQISNTSDATFGWRNDGGGFGFLVPFSDNKNPLINKIQQIYVSNNSERDWSGNSLIVQIVWVFTLFSMLATLPNAQLKVQLLKYTVVGGMLFLLIFEGGRSRYMVQFLPFVIVLAATGTDSIITTLKMVFKSMMNKEGS